MSNTGSTRVAVNWSKIFQTVEDYAIILAIMGAVAFLLFLLSSGISGCVQQDQPEFVTSLDLKTALANMEFRISQSIESGRDSNTGGVLAAGNIENGALGLIFFAYMFFEFRKWKRDHVIRKNGRGPTQTPKGFWGPGND